MNISIKRRRLTESEITQLMQDNRLFSHVAYVSRARWRRFSDLYIIEVDQNFAGVCAVYTFGHWVKLGPVELLKRYHGKGLGKRLLKNIIDDNKHVSLFIASSNPTVQHIIETLGFQKIPNFISLPKKIKLFLLRQTIEHLNIPFFYEGIRKGFFLLRKDTKYYIKAA